MVLRTITDVVANAIEMALFWENLISILNVHVQRWAAGKALSMALQSQATEISDILNDTTLPPASFHQIAPGIVWPP